MPLAFYPRVGSAPSNVVYTWAYILSRKYKRLEWFSMRRCLSPFLICFWCITFHTLFGIAVPIPTSARGTTPQRSTDSSMRSRFVGVYLVPEYILGTGSKLRHTYNLGDRKNSDEITGEGAGATQEEHNSWNVFVSVQFQSAIRRTILPKSITSLLVREPFVMNRRLILSI